MKEVNQYLVKGLTGKKLNSVKAVVIHWFADPMAKATNVIKYWERQANGIAAHDVICLDGTVYHAVPYNMLSYQVGCPRGYTKAALSRLSSYPNNCVVGIECAHLDNKGTMTPETYNSLVELSARLLKKFNLTVNDLWLHSEIVGKDYKDCHRWFTTTKPEDWGKFKQDVNAILNPPKAIVQPVTPVNPVTPTKSTPVQSVSLPTGVYKQGSKGEAVKQIQAALNKLNFKCGNPDGIWGNLTDSALRRFQSVYANPVDGIYGSKTRSAMLKQLSK